MKKGINLKKTAATIALTSFITVLICAIVFSLVFTSMLKNGTALAADGDDSFTAKFSQLKSFIDKYSIYDFDNELGESNSLLYYLSGLNDAYAYYFEPDSLSEYNQETAGSFTGIGINVMTEEETLTDGLFVYRVIGNSPAEKAGIMTGDLIIEADGVSFMNYPYADAVDLLLGEAGTSVDIKVDRNGEEKSFTVTRSAFSQRVVDYKVYDDIGYIVVYKFAENAYQQFRDALTALIAMNVKGIVFDVRNNPGGELNTVVNMIDLLIPANEEVIVIEYKDYEDIMYSTNTKLTDIPFVVLMNNDSASGSELFSSSLRDILGTKLIGEHSYGKGVGQTTFQLPDGSGLKLTTFKYLTKSRTDYNGVGLVPDYEIPLDDKWDMYYYTMTDEDDVQLQKALTVIRQEIENS